MQSGRKGTDRRKRTAKVLAIKRGGAGWIDWTRVRRACSILLALGLALALGPASVRAAAAESLRLNTLRYKSGDATVLDVLNAQNTLMQARDSYAAGLARYRVALANLQTLTGSF
jgi:outer membrane protein TolC